MVLSREVVAEVERLLTEGLARKEIAHRLPVSRGSINTIAAGRWNPSGRKRRSKKPAPEPIEVACVKCRHRVVLPDGEQPCIACRLLAKIETGQIWTLPPRPEVEVGPELELERADAIRYQEAVEARNRLIADCQKREKKRLARLRKATLLS